MNHIVAFDFYLQALTPAERAIATLAMRELSEPNPLPPTAPPGESRPPPATTVAEVIFGVDPGDAAAFAAVEDWYDSDPSVVTELPGGPDSIAKIAAYYLTRTSGSLARRHPPIVGLSDEAKAACDRFFARASPIEGVTQRGEYLMGVARTIRAGLAAAGASPSAPAASPGASSDTPAASPGASSDAPASSSDAPAESPAVLLGRAAADAVSHEVESLARIAKTIGRSAAADTASPNASKYRGYLESIRARRLADAEALRALAGRLAGAADRLDAAARE